MWNAISANTFRGNKTNKDFIYFPPDSSKIEKRPKIKLHFPISDKKRYETSKKSNPFDLNDPSNIKSKYELDPTNFRYNYSSKIGDVNYGFPASESLKERINQVNIEQNKHYFKQRSMANNMAKGSGIIPQIVIPGPKILDKVFGSGIIDIRPRGTAELIFSYNSNEVRNPQYSLRQQNTSQFDFKQKIQLNLTGSIGDKMRVAMNYDTEATFEFENQIKLEFNGKEDDIIKKIELGNVALPLNSTLIQGSQSLFGVKTVMQFGKLSATTVVSQQRGRSQETEMQAGAQNTKFDIQASNYDMNRHFFLSQYFYETYDQAVANLPIINTRVQIRRVEVWVLNRTNAFDNARDIIGFSDLGEASQRINKKWEINPSLYDTFLGNDVNSLWLYLNRGRHTANGADNRTISNNLNGTYTALDQLMQDANTTGLAPLSQYQLINYARQLNQNEYTFNAVLGFVSLNQALNNDDVLMVAYEGTIDGRDFKVGEFSIDKAPNPNQPNLLFLKMIKGPSQRPDLPNWKLMMKNVYSLGSFSIQPKDFKLNIIYADDPSGADLNYIPVQNEPLLTGTPLLTAMNLDRMNLQQEPAPDGLFDYLEGVTVLSSTGRIILPSVEPFGKYLKKKFINDPTRADYYCYFQLYDSTKFSAVQLPQFDKFFLRGTYQGQSGNEISLGATNVPQGSVKVTANGAPLQENIDYIVDYNLGRVKIVNTALLNSGASIKVSSESNSLFQVQQRTMVGTRLDYKANRDFILGSTFMYMNERPLTQKVNVGEEPISNMVVGLDGTYKKDSRFLTKLVDKLPFIETKESSNIIFSGEYAHLIPGVNSALTQGGTAYIDDFENTETPFDLKFGNNWALASTPQGQSSLFPETNTFNSLAYGTKRANIAWYTIANNFYNSSDPFMPQHIKDNPNSMSIHNVRQVQLTDIFPQKQIQTGMPQNLPTFDLAYFPKEKGPYNFNLTDLNDDGTLANPEKNWAGIMRKIDQNDFEQANIDYIEIWMMDPFADNPNSTNKGELVINLGNVSEDILRDNRRSAENGLPKDGIFDASKVDKTIWGWVPKQPVINYAFDADIAARTNQDVGLDGLNNENEKIQFDSTYVKKVFQKFGPTSTAYITANEDPSNDDYHYYLGADYDAANGGLGTDVISRYKKYNKMQGNSIIGGNPPSAATNVPDNEDLNRDYTTNEIESYFQYRIEISPEKLQEGTNFVVDSVNCSQVKLANGSLVSERWYHLKIPVREFQQKFGDINDFKSIRFMRMFMRGFKEDIVLRFGYLQLIRADWRKYANSLKEGGEHKPIDPTDNTSFVVSTVNVEENPNYITPPGIVRQIDFSSPQSIRQNEQAISVKVCNLKDGDARGVFKNAVVDMRQYSRLRLFVHAEGDKQLQSNDVSAFIRFGTDLTNNYYEYEIPLSLTHLGQTDEYGVWPTNNEINILLEDLINAKIARNNAGVSFSAPYSTLLGAAKITVVGMPDFSQTRVMMMGVRNPKRKPGDVNDDGLPKCVDVWFNELRLTEFNTRGGWATTGFVQAKLADFGNVKVSGTLITNGWGGVDKKLNQRSFDDKYQYSIQTSFELGKFFPAKIGISIPFFYSYGNTLIRPLYNPLNPDTKLQKEIDQTTNEQRRERISLASDDIMNQQSYNFTNVRKNRTGMRVALPIDIENFNFTYSFTETYRQNQTIQSYVMQNYKGIAGYMYSFPNSTIEPFSKTIKSNKLALLKEFNFNYLPSTWGFRIETERRYGELINRNNDDKNTIILPLYDKLFTMRRYYEFAWGFTKNIKLDYNATADARIDEPMGRINETTPDKKDSIVNNFWKGGRLTKFDQNIRANYNVPINKIPYLEFVNQSTYSYTVNYQWNQAPPIADSLGNTIQNSRQQQFNLGFNMVSFYNKIKFLKDLTTPANTRQQNAVVDEDKNAKNLKSKDKKKNATLSNETKKYPFYITAPVKIILSLKNVSGTYSLTEGTTLPGFQPKAENFGQNYNSGAPGWDFILGVQNDDYRYKAAQNGWFTNDPRLATPYMQNFQEQINGRALFEPFDDFRIELNVEKRFSKTLSSYFRFDPFDSIGQPYKDFGEPIETGTYSISYLTWQSAFAGDNSENISSVFTQFENNRQIIANRLAEEKYGNISAVMRDSFTFPLGFSRYSQDVLIPAFLATYSGTDPKNIGLSPFPQIPIPNWKINYNGLSKLDLLKNIASNIAISHVYQSTYTVPNFQTISSRSIDTFSSTDLLPKYIIRQIQITERFAPLLGIDITFVNNITAAVKYSKDRALNLSLGSRQLNEIAGEEFTIGIGFRTQKLKLPFGRIVLNNDINFRFDFSIRENVTKVRNLDRESNEPVSGQTIYSLRPSIDYKINDNLMLRIFYDRRQTNPYTSNNYPTVISSGGFSVRYTIQ